MPAAIAVAAAWSVQLRCSGGQHGVPIGRPLRHESRLTAHSGSDIKNAMGSSEDPDEAMATGSLPLQWRAAGVLSCPSRRSSPAGRREGGSEPNATHKATGGRLRGGEGGSASFSTASVRHCSCQRTEVGFDDKQYVKREFRSGKARERFNRETCRTGKQANKKTAPLASWAW